MTSKTAGKYRSKKRSEIIANAIGFLLLVVLAAAVLLPIWWIFRSILMSNASMYSYPPQFFPDQWKFSNYAETLQTYDFLRYLKNSFIIIVPSVFGGVFTATLAAYAFSRLRFREKKLMFTLCVGSMLLPGTVTMIPLYLMWTNILHLNGTFLPLILPYFCGGGAFNIFLIRQFISAIPRELDEAATIDGANRMQILFRILLPAIRPALIVVGLFIFIAIWNDLLQQTLYISEPENYTIAIGLSMFKSSLKVDWVKIMCATCLSFLPGIIIYLIGQRYFVEGVVMTGMKN